MSDLVGLFISLQIVFHSFLLEFCLKRVILRSLAMLAVLVTCQIFPQFGPIVDLVGGKI